ncbi:hypothetical protein L7F22_003376 [Adiantum nelumboides]|nr:hypothetical protein [Adiantum nelumboides]
MMPVVLLFTLAGAIPVAERRMAQEQDDDEIRFGSGDSGCLKGLLKNANQTEGMVMSTWTAAALDSPCNRTAGSLAGVTCNNISRVASIRLPSAGLAGTLASSLSLCTDLTTLIMSGNNLSGPIPTTLGNLAYLVTLSLADNQLSGTVPFELATCYALTSLDLHDNQLSGSIPGQLGLLHLQEFNVSYNRLQGIIPVTLSNSTTGAPRFNASSFDHNPNLHGYPLIYETPVAPSSKKDETAILYKVVFSIVAVLGLALVVILCFWAAHSYRSRRELAQRQQQRQNVGSSSRSSNRSASNYEDGWKQVLIQLDQGRRSSSRRASQ